MVHVSPTVLDVARSIAALDENPESESLVDRVAQNLAYQLHARFGRWDFPDVDVKIVGGILLAYGASMFTAEQASFKIVHHIKNM